MHISYNAALFKDGLVHVEPLAKWNPKNKQGICVPNGKKSEQKKPKHLTPINKMPTPPVKMPTPPVKMSDMKKGLCEFIQTAIMELLFNQKLTLHKKNNHEFYAYPNFKKMIVKHNYDLKAAIDEISEEIIQFDDFDYFVVRAKKVLNEEVLDEDDDPDEAYEEALEGIYHIILLYTGLTASNLEPGDRDQLRDKMTKALKLNL